MPLFKKRSDPAEDTPVKRGRGRPPKEHPLEAAPIKQRLPGREIKLPITKALVILVLALIPAAYFYKQSQDNKQDKVQTAAQDTQNEVEEVVRKVSQHALLPQGETPTLATVTDPAKLRNQVFFKHAEEGDKVLIYNKAKRAIIYRPSLDRVIETAPVDAKP